MPSLQYQDVREYQRKRIIDTVTSSATVAGGDHGELAPKHPSFGAMTLNG